MWSGTTGCPAKRGRTSRPSAWLMWSNSTSARRWRTAHPNFGVVGYLEHAREGVIIMNCPACGTAMTEIAVSGLKIQARKGGCGGLWFDEWTLRKVDQPDQSSGEALLHIEQNPA